MSEPTVSGFGYKFSFFNSSMRFGALFSFVDFIHDLSVTTSLLMVMIVKLLLHFVVCAIEIVENWLSNKLVWSKLVACGTSAV